MTEYSIRCPKCGSEPIEQYEYGKEGPQRLVCRRVFCGTVIDFDEAARQVPDDER